MSEHQRCGFERRKHQTEITSNHRSGEDQRVIAKNYYQFIKILKKIPIFKELTIQQFQMILNICSKQFYKKNEKLFLKGDDSHEMFILIQGELKITFRDGKEFSRIHPVGFVGEMGIFTSQPRSATVEAATDSILLTIHKTELFKLFEKDCFIATHILMNVIKDLSCKLRNDNIIIEELRQMSFPGDFTKVLSKILTENESS